MAHLDAMKAMWLSVVVLACSSPYIRDTTEGEGGAGGAGADGTGPSPTAGAAPAPSESGGTSGGGASSTVGGAGDGGAALEGGAGGAPATPVDENGEAGAAGAPPSPTPPVITGTTYYVSNDGDDEADGTSPEAAWRTLAKVAGAALEPGDGVLLRRGDAWREQLVANVSGEPESPITYGAFGQGDRPQLWGSDDVPAEAFRESALGANVYEFEPAAAVNCALEDHAFLRSAALIANSADLELQRAALLETPGSWWTDGELSFVHLEEDPREGGRVISICVREDLLWNNDQSHLVFQDLDLFESAKYGGGYAARVQGGTGVLLKDVTAYRAGKHHFGAIGTDEFTGLRLVALDSMPDQRLGGASPFVSYGSGENDQDSEWIDCKSDPKSNDYPSFVMHGTGIASVLLKNLVSIGYGPAIQTEHEDTVVRIEGGSVDNGYLAINGTNVIVDGTRVFGPQSMVIVKGTNNTLQNLLVYGQTPDWWGGKPAAIQDYGVGTRILFSTILSEGASRGGAVAFMEGAQDGELVGNIVAGKYDDEPALRISSEALPPGLVSNHNQFRPAAKFALIDANMSAEEWRALGFDSESTWSSPELDPKRRPCSGAPGVEVPGMTARDFGVLLDANGVERAAERYDAGAFVAVECG